MHQAVFHRSFFDSRLLILQIVTVNVLCIISASLACAQFIIGIVATTDEYGCYFYDDDSFSYCIHVVGL